MVIKTKQRKKTFPEKQKNEKCDCNEKVIKRNSNRIQFPFFAAKTINQISNIKAFIRMNELHSLLVGSERY